jgi:hypothetical protein
MQSLLVRVNPVSVSSQTMNAAATGRTTVNDELESIWKEVVVT